MTKLRIKVVPFETLSSSFFSVYMFINGARRVAVDSTLKLHLIAAVVFSL